MFKGLSSRLASSFNKLKGIGRLSDSQIAKHIKDIRLALLEADVALPVVKDFAAKVRKEALGQQIVKSVRPGDAFVKIVNDILTSTLGSESHELNLKVEPPVIILMAGLQGSGKTTTAGKLALWLKETHKKSVVLASADVYRPAAILQLETLANSIEADFFPSTEKEKPVKIAKKALDYAKKQHKDILILDTAGRQHIDDALMKELQDISKAINPTETLLVVDAMMGQEAATLAKAFDEQITLTGSVLSKADGDARGGAALSMRWMTEKPIKFIGTGEKLDGLERFNPDRVAGRILGKGDIVSLVEDAKKKVDQKVADKLAKKIRKGKSFTFDDFLTQLDQMQKLGGAKSLLSKMPGMGLPKGAANMLDDKMFVRMKAIIQSMTPQEKIFPALINGSRKRRIADGSGTTIQDVNKLAKQFGQMQKMMKRMKGNKMQRQMQQLQGMPGMGDKIPKELLDQL